MYNIHTYIHQAQSQSACAVAVTCPEGSTTVRPPATGTLIITKSCEEVCPGEEFPITFTTSNNPQPPLVLLRDGESQAVTLGPGRFTIHESNLESGGVFFQGDCTPVDGPFSGDATGTISAGETLTCTVINSGT
jgi:hypothetical protein